jgi:quinol monooxygenase YgiN
MSNSGDNVVKSGMNAEITIIVPVKARKEFIKTVREKLLKLAELTQKEDGNICYCLNQVKDEPDHFVIYEKWKNQTALDYHMNQDYLKSFLSESKNLLTEEIRGTICQEIP